MPEPAGPSHLVVEFLRDRDVACPACLYNLRAASADRCPECGTPLHLEVTGSVSGVFWWLASVIGGGIALLVVGVSLMHLLGDVHRLLEDPNRLQLVAAGAMSFGELPRWGAIVGLAAIVSAIGIALAWLVTSRRRFGRMARSRRIAIGLSSALAPLLVLGVLRLVIVFL